MSGAAASAQPHLKLADSLRRDAGIPELAYAVFNADTIYESAVLGQRIAGGGTAAAPSDRFHLGSNTKAISCAIAEKLVASGKLKWSTIFFSLFPELRQQSRSCYRNITLEQLLTFRSGLPSYTYTFSEPTPAAINGNESQQRYALARWFLRQRQQLPANGLTPTNAGYVLAGLMLERASGQTYQSLARALGNETGTRFDFNEPNFADSLQPWGHDASGVPASPQYSVKLNWLLAAGNINCDLPGYVRFLQKLLPQRSTANPLFPAADANNLLFGKDGFAFGWFQQIKRQDRIAWNQGDAGHFISHVVVRRSDGMVFVVLTNRSGDDARGAVDALIKRLQRAYHN